jgi:hypothetical protein
MAPQPLIPQHPPGKPRIFLVGFNKCGTTSFHNFFKANGIASVHYRFNTLAMTMHQNLLDGHRPLLDGMEYWTAYTDLICVPGTPWGRSNSDDQPMIEACTYFRELHRDYPDALFILNTRDPFAWIQSRLQHEEGRFANGYRAALAHEGIQTEEQLCERWLQDWYTHHSGVLTYFQSHAPSQLLLFHLKYTPVAKLVEFLEPHFEIPCPAFPHDNTSKEKQVATPAQIQRRQPTELTMKERLAMQARVSWLPSLKQLISSIPRRLHPCSRP